MTPLPLPLTVPSAATLPPSDTSAAAPPPTGSLPALPSLPAANSPTAVMAEDDELAMLVGFSQAGVDLRAEVSAQTLTPPPADGVHNVAVTLLCKEEWVPVLDDNGQPILEGGKQKGSFVEFPGKYVRQANPKNSPPFLVMRVQYNIVNEQGAVVKREEDEITTSPRQNGSMSMLDFARAVAAAKGELGKFPTYCAAWKADMTGMVRYIRDYMLEQQRASGSVSLPAVIQTHFMPIRPATEADLKAIKSDRERAYAQANGVPDKANAIYGLEKVKAAADGKSRPREVKRNGVTYNGSTITRLVQWGPELG